LLSHRGAATGDAVDCVRPQWRTASSGVTNVARRWTSPKSFRCSRRRSLRYFCVMVCNSPRRTCLTPWREIFDVLVGPFMRATLMNHLHSVVMGTDTVGERENETNISRRAAIE
jgi:hypothetical protein